MTGRARILMSYLLLVAAPVVGVFFVLGAGAGLRAGGSAAAAASGGGAAPSSALSLSLLLLQVIIIILGARLMGALLRKLRQPQVVGEMLAGILLGRSVLGLFAPGAYAVMFPAGSLHYLNALSQIGVLLFMFLIGLELDPKLLRGRGHTAVLTSHASIAAPMFLGVSLALVLYPRLADGSVGFTPFALFLGAAMAVTAFPVLARILFERGMQQTRLGSLAIACAAVDDVTAWCILAVVVAITRAAASPTPLWVTLGGAAAFVAVMLGVVRPVLGAAYARVVRQGRSPFQDLLAAVLIVTLAAAWTTERLGVHALFGAFLAGVAMPKDPAFVKGLVGRFEDLMITLLLPLFFAYTGLRMAVDPVSGGGLWLLCALVIGTAIAGKLGGAALASRMTGLSWRDSWTLGALMNTRGLMELIILNVGLDLGVISPTLFSMMVLMAVTTTVMSTPIVEWLNPAIRAHANVGRPLADPQEPAPAS